MLNSTWPGPVGETYSVSPAGSGLYPFQDNAATIYTIANTGAMLIFGQERSKENTALAAEPCCAHILPVAIKAMAAATAAKLGFRIIEASAA